MRRIEQEHGTGGMVFIPGGQHPLGEVAAPARFRTGITYTPPIDAQMIQFTGDRPSITPPILMAASETAAMIMILKKTPR